MFSILCIGIRLQEKPAELIQRRGHRASLSLVAQQGVLALPGDWPAEHDGVHQLHIYVIDVAKYVPDNVRGKADNVFLQDERFLQQDPLRQPGEEVLRGLATQALELSSRRVVSAQRASNVNVRYSRLAQACNQTHPSQTQHNQHESTC